MLCFDGFFICRNYKPLFFPFILMESVIITPKNESQLSELKKFIASSHLEAKVLSDEDKEDIGLQILMSEADMNDLVSEDEVMKILAQA